jgi:cytoskeletal protein CcmA (bactofilin family)
MSSTVDRTPNANRLYLGEGATIKGAVVVADTVVVEGTLEGDIAVDNLIVSETGVVSGRISVGKSAEIFGRVFEKLDVKGLLILRASGRVDGSISFGALTIERGACITGEVSSTDYRTNQQSSYRAQLSASKPVHQQDERPASPAATAAPLELSTVDLMPGPITATA